MNDRGGMIWFANLNEYFIVSFYVTKYAEYLSLWGVCGNNPISSGIIGFPKVNNNENFSITRIYLKKF